MALLEDGVLVPHDVGRPDFLNHKRAVTGHALAVPTLAERLAPHGGAIVYNNVSPGAAYVHDPDSYGHVYHRAGSYAPGRASIAPLPVTLDSAGDRIVTDHFIADALNARRPALAVLWLAEPDHSQHEMQLGSPEHLAVLHDADRNAGRAIAAVDALRAAGDEVLLIVGSDHGHETVSGVVDIEAELIAGGLKSGRALERRDRDVQRQRKPDPSASGCRTATRPARRLPGIAAVGGACCSTRAVSRPWDRRRTTASPSRCR